MPSWDQAPPSEQELKRSKAPAATSWDHAPPSPEELREPEQPGLLQKALTNVVVPVGRFVDTYTGAPSRAALNASIEGKNPISAFTGQFGARPENAPTGKDIAKKLGAGETKASDAFPELYSEKGSYLSLVPGLIGEAARAYSGAENKLPKGGLLDPTASGALGLGIDIGADWSNLIPGALALRGSAKVASKAASTVTKGLVKGTAGAADLITGTRGATRAVETGTELAQRTKDIVSQMLNPKRAVGFDQAVEIAKKNGIDPALLGSNIEFGQTSTIARLERGLREGPTGEKLWDQYTQGYQAITDALNNKVAKTSGGMVRNEREAGALIKGSFAKAQDTLLGSMDMTYKKAGEYAPGLFINRAELKKLDSTLSGVEKFAKGRVKRGIDNVDKEQGRQLLRAVDAIRATKGSYKQTVEALEMIGRKAFNNKTIIGQVPPDLEKLQDLYFKMSEAVINTVRKDINPQFADELVANNKTMSEFFGNRSIIKPALESDRADEALFRTLIASGDSKKIEAIKKMLPPQDVQALKGAMLNSLIKPNSDGVVSFAQVLNAMRGKKNQLEALFEPKELQELTELLRLGVDYGPAVLSFSGTGGSNSFREFGKGLLTGFRDEKALEMMKSKARSQTPSAGRTPPPAPPKGGLLSQPKGLLEKAKKSPKPKRGAMETRLKGAQSVSPSLYSREDEQ